MLVSAVGLAGMTTLGVHTPYWQSGLWLLIVGVGSGMFNSPNTAAMMGTVPAYRRGVAAGARTLLQNTGAVLSIAFVLAIVTSAVPRATLFAVFSGLAKGLSAQKLAPFIDNMHVALWVLAATSLAGTFVSLLRPRHARGAAGDGFAPPQPASHPAPTLGPAHGNGASARAGVARNSHPRPDERSEPARELPARVR
jgi:hypothetical protein